MTTTAEVATALAVTVRRGDLASALAWVKTGLPRRPVVAVLAGIRVEASGASLHLAAFDYDMSTRATIGCSGETDGVALVNGAALVKAVQGFPKGAALPVKLAAGAGGLAVSCGGVSVTIPAMPLEDYPQLPEMPPLAGHLGAGFGAAWAQVAVATGEDVRGLALHCVQTTLSADSAGLAATDKYRLAASRAPFTPAGTLPDGPLMLPVHGISALIKAAKGAPLALHVGEPYKSGREQYGPIVGMSDGWRELTVRASSGAFPNVGPVMNTEYLTSVTVDAGALAAAVKRGGSVTERYEPVRLIATDRAVTVQGISDGKPAVSECVRATLTGAPVLRHYSPGYLADLVTGITGDVVLEFPASGKPMRIAAGEFTAILMPIRNGHEDEAELIAAAAAAVREAEEEEANVDEATTVTEAGPAEVEAEPVPGSREWRIAQGHDPATVDAAMTGTYARGDGPGRDSAGERVRAATGGEVAVKPAQVTAPAYVRTPDAAQMLGQVMEQMGLLYGRHVQFSSRAQVIAVTGWTAQAAAKDGDGKWPWMAYPRLLPTSHRNGSGKSTVADIARHMFLGRAGRPSKITPYGLCKVLKTGEPAICDDAQDIFTTAKTSRELLRVLINGYTPGATWVSGQADGRIEAAEGPAMVVGKDDLITKLAEFVTDLIARAIVIRLDRPSVYMPQFDREAQGTATALGKALAAITAPLAGDLRAAETELARAMEGQEIREGDGGRIAQIWRPLLATAAVAGDRWPDAMGQAMEEIGTAGYGLLNAADELARIVPVDGPSFWDEGG